MYSPLSREDELDLVRRAKNNDPESRAALVEYARGLAVSIARKAARKYEAMPIKDDLEQEGIMGFLEAVKKFDPDRGLRLSTYAAYWIRFRVNEAAQEFYQNQQRMRSMDVPLTGKRQDFFTSRRDEYDDDLSGYPKRLHDLVGDADAQDPGLAALDAQVSDRMMQHLEVLPRDFQDAIRWHFGIGSPKLSVKEIAEQLETSERTVRILIDQGLASLRASMTNLR